MRLPPFPKPHADELLFSTLCRAWEISNYSLKDFKALLHTHTRQKPVYHTCHPIFPVRADFLCSALPKNFLTPEIIVERHSVLPYYRPFIPDRIYRRLLESTGVPGSEIRGIPYFSKHRLKYCSQCIREDLKATPARRPYLRTLHQVDGYMVCHLHHEWLNILASTGKTHHHGYPFDALSGLDPDRSPSMRPIPEVANTLAHDIASVPDVFPNILAEQLWNVMAGRLYSPGARKNLPQQDRREVAKLVKSIPGLTLAPNDLGIEIHQRIFRPSACALALLLIRYAGETPASFVSLISTGQIRKARHACLNPLCEHSGQRVIEDRRDLIPGTGYYRFACPFCGFSYALTIYQLENPISAGLKVYSLGDRMPEFRRLWADPKVSFMSLTKRFKLTYSSILHLVHFQRMSMDRGGRLARSSSLRAFRKGLENERRKLEGAKTILLEAFAKDPKLLVFRRDSPSKIISAFNNLLLRDPAWLAKLQKKKRRKLQIRRGRLGL